MKIAYLIQSHKNTAQVARLVRVLRELDPACHIDVSHDRRDGAGIESLATPDVRVTRDEGGRGGFHPIQRWLNGVDRISEAGGADYVVLISGQDYPIRPMTQMHEALAASGDGFLECFPALQREGNHWPVREGRSRYLFSWRELFPISDRLRAPLYPLHAVNRIQPWLRCNVAYGGLKVGVRRRDGLPPGLQCYGGSMFPSLSWAAARYVRTVAEERPDVVRWARRSLVSDESFFQSVLMSSGAFDLELSSRRYYAFDQSRFGHPAVLGASDLGEILTSDAFFARKFDIAVDAHVLDLIDQALDAAGSGVDR